ncbi:MAG: hypothetical protein HYT98_02045 [Candidatus Sungbacteria bacterium]|nr:hypothetical protein [Candidatus Sungbacteria bacterium]
MIKCLIWDVAETILAYDFQEVMAKLARISGKSPEEVLHIFGGDYSNKCSLIYSFDAGEIETEEFIVAVRDLLGIDHTVPSGLIMDMFYHCHRMPKGTESLLRFLRKSYIQGIVSNMNLLQWSYIEHVFPIISDKRGIMDFHLLSFREKLMKPDLKIYEHAFRRAYDAYETRKNGSLHCELKRSNCLFLDDREENITGALDFGFRAVCVQPASKVGYCGIFEALRREGIAVPLSRSGHRKRH